ncbi:MAG: hypothetical protein JSV36_21600 [Anaerolineae bacterium]|nr:MAG: hypothetical protein JSV36_21600 [Anaerolineae bacterium]
MKLRNPKRPLSLIVFAAWIATLGLISLARSALHLWQVPVLLELGLATNWPVVTLGMVWGLGLLGGAGGLWLRWAPARWAVLLLVPAYYLTHWLDWMLSIQASYGRSRIGPYTVLALLAIAYSTWFLTRRRTRQQFQR